jgi:hypothetical protein
MSDFSSALMKGLGGGISSALTGGLATVLGSGLGALLGDSSDDNKELMQLQAQYSKELMNYQHQLNSPAEYVSQLKDAGLSTALMFSKGANQVATSLGSSPQGDLAGIVQSKAIMSQLGMQAAQTQLLKSEAKKNDVEAKGKEIENKVKAAESKEQIATAEEYHKFMNETFYTAEEYEKAAADAQKMMLTDFYEDHPDVDVQFEDEDNEKVPYFIDSDGNKNYLVSAVNLFGLTRRYRNFNREFNGSELAYATNKINNEFLDLQRKVYEKYGDKVESAKLSQAMAYVRNAIQDANMKALDYKVFEKLGLGPNVIRTIVTGAQALSGNLNSLVFGAEAMLK